MSWNRDADWEHIADGLDRMADLLPGRWAQGGDVGPDIDPRVIDRNHCIATMANHVFGVCPVIDDVMEIICEQVGIPKSDRDYPIRQAITWNDHVCKSEAEAINVCKGSAMRARMRAEGIEADRMIQRMTTL